MAVAAFSSALSSLIRASAASAASFAACSFSAVARAAQFPPQLLERSVNFLLVEAPGRSGAAADVFSGDATEGDATEGDATREGHTASSFSGDASVGDATREGHNREGDDRESLRRAGCSEVDGLKGSALPTDAALPVVSVGAGATAVRLCGESPSKAAQRGVALDSESKIESRSVETSAGVGALTPGVSAAGAGTADSSLTPRSS